MTIPVSIVVDDLGYPGVIVADVDVGKNARGVVVFAHGSGSSRKSPRNIDVARALVARGFATVLCDLLTSEEADVDALTRGFRFDVPRLTTRVVGAVRWAREHAPLRGLPVGLFGASTGAAAALRAAALLPHHVAAVVSRGGRPDLAGDALADVVAPTLLLVGGDDVEVLALNRRALAALRGSHRLDVIPSASHLFEEPGALEAVVERAGDWFVEHLRPLPSLALL